MIFEEVVLHNFGVYRGRHSVPLSVSPDRPIVLLGAMNGSGKTTFLDAMQLALYGKSARCTGRERISYHDYLESMINRGTASSQGAGVEFTFLTRSNGQPSSIRIDRTWNVHGQGVRENLEVFRDGVIDPVASERWQEFVEDFMPSQIADLFFFDGEKIEGLADTAKSAALLRVGIHSLLGIDLVENLVKSLQTIERKRKSKTLTDSARGRLNSLEGELGILQERRSAALQKVAASMTELDVARRETEVVSTEFKRMGGDLFNRRDLLEQEKIGLLGRKDELSLQLRELVGGLLPTRLVSKLVGLMLTKAEQSSSSRNQKAMLGEAIRRDKALVRFLGERKVKKESLAQIEEYLSKDRTKRYAPSEQTLALPANLLEKYHSDDVIRSRKKAISLLKDLDATNERLTSVERNLSAVPEQSIVAEIQQRMDKCRSGIARFEATQALCLSERDEIEAKITRLEQKIAHEERGLREEILKDEVSRRVSTQSAEARETLGRFRDRLLRENLVRLQTSISSCFQRLLQKKSLFRSVVISPDTFELSLIHPAGTTVPAHRLSAGERQLLAVATLWALTQASGRHLPAVIDTPLSRLDSLHRGTIVRNYFPHASHQVVLLSTDEEVVGAYYASLRPHIGREYVIEHDDALGISRIRDGYFPDLSEFREEAA